jgi:arsenite-transporting ATPase
VATSTSRRGSKPDTTYHLFGGKGGVGKTTCAAAHALTLAAEGARTLIVSTDPAPSLGDVLGERLTSQPRRIRSGGAALFATEINAARAMQRWLRARRATLEAIALRGTWLDEWDISALLSLTLPGIDEVAALLELLRFGESARYDAIVIDAAPTGHTLRMLALPDTMSGVARVFDHMQQKHRVMVDALRGAWRPDDADVLIRQLHEDAQSLGQLLRSNDRTHVSWVTLAEQLSVEETMDALAWLSAEHMTVGRIIVNGIRPVPVARCRWCRAVRRHQLMVMSRLATRISSSPDRSAPAIVQVLGREKEPVGLRALRLLGRELTRKAMVETKVDRPGRVYVAARARGRWMAKAELPFDPLAARLVIFGGKGGVGKTTCAAATALDVAHAYPGMRLLLMSIDPAHSLGDVFDLDVTDRAWPVPGGPPNLRVRHLDSTRALATLRDRCSNAIDALFDRVTGGSSIDVSHDRRVMQGLLDLAPPGLDELAAILDVVRLLDTAGADGGLIVMDSAPTGHAVRLLEMPELVQDWVKALMAIVLKYQPVTGIGELGSALLELSRAIRRLRTLMADPHLTSFVVVTRPADVPLAETRRLLGTLSALRVHVPAIIVNAVGAGECHRCRRDVADHDVAVRSTAMAARSRGITRLIVAPAMVPAPIGVPSLIEWRKTWRTGSV